MRTLCTLFAAVAVVGLALVADAAIPQATVCFFGNVNPVGYAYVSYLQPRFPGVQFTPAVVGLISTRQSYENRTARLRADIQAKQCTVVIDNGGTYNYTLYRNLRAEPGMPLWVEYQYGKSTFDTYEQPDKYPALRMWQEQEDQSITAINTALALGWLDVVIASTNKTGDNVTLARVTKQAKDGGLRVHASFVQGEEGMETMDDFITKISADTPTRAVLIATSQTSVVQALVDAPKGLVPIVPVDKKTDYRIRGSLGVLAPQELVHDAPHQWDHHWKNFTDMKALWEAWQPAEPSSWSEYYFRNTSSPSSRYYDMDVIAMAAIHAYYNKTAVPAGASAVPPPTAHQILAAAGDVEVDGLTKPLRIANHTGGTLAPARSLEVVLTQPPKSGIYYQWKVIANVSSGGVTWRTDAVLQWPAVGKMKGIVEPLFPGPPSTDTSPDYAVIAVMSALGLFLIVALVAVAAYFGSRWARLRHCPKNTEEPFTAFFVSTHNEDEIRDLYGYKAHEVFSGVRDAVLSAAQSHHCYIARRLEAHYLLVAKRPEDAVLCAAEVVTKVSKLTAKAPPKPKAKTRRAGTGTPSGRNTYAAGSDSKSERSARSRAMATGIAASQARRTGVVPRVAVGMSLAHGRIELEEGAYTYGGEPVDVAAAVADFAVCHQVLATQELVQALPPNSPAIACFEEYCEREVGRGRCAENYELLEYVADGCPRADPEQAQAAREGKNDGGGAPGALSAALQAQAGGLVTRSVAVVAIHIPELGVRATDAAAIGRVEEAFDIISTSADDFKGTFAAMHDGWCVVTVNGTGGVAQAPMRATSLAVAAVDTLRDVGFVDATAGVTSGPTIAGGIASNAAAARHMTSGGNAERARLLALGAEACDAAVLVAEGVKREADSSFEFAAADIMGVRAPVTPAAGDGKVELGLKALEATPKPTTMTHRTLTVYGVVAASSAGDVEDEWMYQLAAAGTGPCVRINAAFDLIAEGSVAEARVKLSEASAALAVVDSPALAGVDGEGHAVLKAAVARGEELCTTLCGSGRCGGDHRTRLTQYGVDRTASFVVRGI